MLNIEQFLNKNFNDLSKNNIRINVDYRLETLLSFMEVYNESSNLLNEEKINLELDLVKGEYIHNKKGKNIKQLASDVWISSEAISKLLGLGEDYSFAFDSISFLWSTKNTKNDFLSSLRFIEESQFEDDAPPFYEDFGDVEVNGKFYWIISEKTK